MNPIQRVLTAGVLVLYGSLLTTSEVFETSSRDAEEDVKEGVVGLSVVDVLRVVTH